MYRRPSPRNLLGRSRFDPMRVVIPDPLVSYTGGHRVEADGETLDEILTDLDRQFPGIRFRVVDEQDNLRKHMLFFVRGERTRNLYEPVSDSEEVVLVHALSGG